MFGLFVGLLLTFLEIRVAFVTLVDHTDLDSTNWATSILQTGRSIQPSPLVSIRGTIPITSASALYLPLVTSSCSLPPNLSSSATILREDAPLYTGPGNLDYGISDQLLACTIVSAKAIYGEFVKVEVTNAGNTTIGFVHKKAIYQPLTASLY
jgi:hypothetical protein